jgi:hypothetical protein
MTATLDSAIGGAAPPRPLADAFGHRLVPPGDPLEGQAFDAIYEQKIKPELVKRERDRKGALQTFVVVLLGGAVLVFLENLLAPSITGHLGDRVDLRIALATMALAGVLGWLPVAAVARNAKAAVITALCEPLGVAYSIKPQDAPAFDTFLALHLLPRPDDKAFQDLFTGRRGEVDFALCEATLHRGSGKSRTLVFQGQIFRLTAPRRRGSTTVVLRNSGWLNRFECPKGLSAVGLEDPVFNKSFCVFGSDQVEAREILTPAFMQRLNELEAAYRGGHIRCAFEASELLIALESPDQFEIGGMFSTLVERGRVEGIARNIEQVFKLIDEFGAA